MITVCMLEFYEGHVIQHIVLIICAYEILNS